MTKDAKCQIKKASVRFHLRQSWSKKAWASKPQAPSLAGILALGITGKAQIIKVDKRIKNPANLRGTEYQGLLL